MDTKQWLCAEASSGCASAGACVLPAAAPHAAAVPLPHLGVVLEQIHEPPWHRTSSALLSMILSVCSSDNPALIKLRENVARELRVLTR